MSHRRRFATAALLLFVIGLIALVIVAASRQFDQSKQSAYVPDPNQADNDRADQLIREGREQINRRRSDKAIASFREAMEIFKRTKGERSFDYARGMGWLAVIEPERTEAEALFTRTLEILKQTIGDRHIDYSMVLSNFASRQQEWGNHAKAEEMLLEAGRVMKSAVGEKNRDYALSLRSLGTFYLTRGDYVKAETVLEEAMVILKADSDQQDPLYALIQQLLAVVYQKRGAVAKAKEMSDRAKEVLDPAMGVTTSSVLEKARRASAGGQLDEAEKHLLKALEMTKAEVGEQNISYMEIQRNLARLYGKQGKFDKAESIFSSLAFLYGLNLGEKNDSYLDILADQAHLRVLQRDYAKAEKLLQKVSDLRLASLGERHPDFAESLLQLAKLHNTRDDFAKAAPLFQRASRLTREHLDVTATIQSDAEQQVNAAYLRRFLDQFAFSWTPAKGDVTPLYAEVLAWKGAVTARQRQSRSIRTILQTKPDAATQKLLADLNAASRELAALALAGEPPPGVDRAKKSAELAERREQLEKDLARTTTAFRRQRDAQKFGPTELQRTLPDGVALVDFIEHQSGEMPGPLWLVAFVVTNKTIAGYKLGPTAPIAAAVDQFRERLNRAKPAADKSDPGSVLREKIWDQLAKPLAGTKLVLISPDGPLNRLPFAALPGNDRQRFLIEEVALAVVPVVQLLPELLERRDADTRLLAVGDVNFDAETASEKLPPGASGTRAASTRKWSPLPGTASEVAAIETMFRQSRPGATADTLRGTAASESAIRGKIQSASHVHFATHGFFAACELKSFAATPGAKPSGHHPGVLSGLVFAGANKPAGNDDGILTALEVGDLDLRKIDMAVLSACETGLGEVAGGQGVLGLQRAFQTAGAGSVVTSLWQIPDEPTRVLMERFYANLWRKKLPKLEALREAQLWMLREGKAHPGVARGLTRDDSPALTDDGRLPPYFWAAFVLSGDWR